MRAIAFLARREEAVGPLPTTTSNAARDGRVRAGVPRFGWRRLYYNADSLANLREGMFAGKYFDPKNGTFKLVYYPAMGQTEPPQAASSKEIVR